MFFNPGIKGESVDNGSQSMDKSFQLYHAVLTSMNRVTCRTINLLILRLLSERETLLNFSVVEMIQQI